VNVEMKHHLLGCLKDLKVSFIVNYYSIDLVFKLPHFF
jgi:hypothetical protein